MPNSLMSSLSLPKLKSLTLNHNPIVKIRESTVIIEEILPIEHLSLQYGNLSLIATHDFTGFFQLKELFISANKINKISPSAFRPLVNLKTLDLSQNVIEILPEERLSGLTSLRKLNLSMNELLELPHFKEDLQNLEILDLSFNRITRVEYEMTKLGASLLHISLNHNMIGSIAVNAFSNMTSLQTLDLSQNFLTFLSSDLFQSIEIRIKRIIISGLFTLYLQTTI
jgi:Leucine-rich repeat (LRR) protein